MIIEKKYINKKGLSAEILHFDGEGDFDCTLINRFFEHLEELLTNQSEYGGARYRLASAAEITGAGRADVALTLTRKIGAERVTRRMNITVSDGYIIRKKKVRKKG